MQGIRPQMVIFDKVHKQEIGKVKGKECHLTWKQLEKQEWLLVLVGVADDNIVKRVR